MRILLLGHTGFLGSYLESYLESNCDYEIIHAPTGSHLEPYQLFSLLGELLQTTKYDVVINCIAKVKTSNLSELEQSNHYVINSLLPISYISAVYPSLISHSSNTSLLSSLNGCTDVYSQSKLLADQLISSSSATVLRTNIVGISPAKRGLIAWALYQIVEQQPLSLFTDQIISPVSLNYFSQVINQVFQDKYYGLYDIFSTNCIEV